MKRKNLIILCIIFILSGAYVLLFESKPAKKADEPEEIQKILVLDPGRVTEISLKTKDRHLSFKRQDRQWHMESPVQAKAENSKVDSLLAIFDYGVIREINDNASDLSQYGLVRPEIELTFKVEGEAHFQTLQLGEDSPSGINCYAKLEGRPKVYLVGLLYKQDLKKDVSYFVD